jgi:hypothetical protein
MPLFDEARRAYIVPFTLRNRFTLAADGGLLEFGEPDQLYLNDGRGHFSPAPWIGGRFLDEAGKPLASEPLDWGVGVVFRDLNRDGKPDLIVSNDEWTPDRIFLNLGEGRFRAVPTSQFPLGASLSRGVDVADVNGDGELDIWIAEQRGEDLAERRAEVARAPATPRDVPLQSPRAEAARNVLAVKNARGYWEDRAWTFELATTGPTFAAIFADLDLDGFPDAVTSCGAIRNRLDAAAAARIARARAAGEFLPTTFSLVPSAPVTRMDLFTKSARAESAMLPERRGAVEWRRNLEGRGFSKQSLPPQAIGQPRGMLAVDLDQDGDLDLVANCVSGAPILLKNRCDRPRLVVRFASKPARSMAGVRALFRVPGLPPQSGEVVSGGRFLSGGPEELVFAAGRAAGELEVVAGRRFIQIFGNHRWQPSFDQRTASVFHSRNFRA